MWPLLLVLLALLLSCAVDASTNQSNVVGLTSQPSLALTDQPLSPPSLPPAAVGVHLQPASTSLEKGSVDGRRAQERLSQSGMREHLDAQALFERDGFYVVRDALSDDDIRFIEDRILQHSGMYNNLRAFPRMRQHPITAPATERLHNCSTMHSALSRIFGSPAGYRATQGRADYAINKLKGWHRDYPGYYTMDPLREYFRPPSSGKLDQFSVGPEGETQKFVLAAAYLQDHRGDDGALTVKAGTHRASFCCWPNGTCPEGSVALCHNGVSTTVLHPNRRDIILVDYRVIHRSALAMRRNSKRILVALGYGAQDNIFTEAAERFYELREATESGNVCAHHKLFTSSWNDCVLAAARSDLRRDPLPRRAQRCDPHRPPDDFTPGQRPGCPLSAAPLAPYEPGSNERRFKSFVSVPKEGNHLADGVPGFVRLPPVRRHLARGKRERIQG